MKNKVMVLLLSVVMALSAITGGTLTAQASSVSESGGVGETPVTVTAEALMLDVTVPTVLPVNVAADGTVTTATDAKVINNSAGPVVITSVKVTEENGWTNAGFVDLTGEKVGTKKFGMQIQGADVAADGSCAPAWESIGPAGSDSDELALAYDAKIAPQAQATEETMAKVVFTIGWDKVDEEPVVPSNAAPLAVTQENRAEICEYTETTTDLVVPPYVDVAGETYKVTEIGDEAFKDATQLESISLPNTLEKIGNEAFAGCVQLDSPSIPNGVVSIGQNAFTGIDNIRYDGFAAENIPWGANTVNGAVYAPIAVTQDVLINMCGVDARIYSPDTTSLPINPNVVIEIPSVIEGEDGTLYRPVEVARDVFDVTADEVVIPEGVKRVNGLFSGGSLSRIGRVVLPDTVTTIDYGGGGGVTTLYIPSSVTEVVDSYGNSVTTSLVLGVNSQTRCLFYDGECSALRGVSGVCRATNEWRISEDGKLRLSLDGTVVLGANDFDMTSCTIPEGVVEINKGAFSGGGKLQHVTFPSTLRTVGNASFFRCHSLETVDWNDGLEKIGDDAFSMSCNLASANLPDSITELGSYSFQYCTGLKTVHVPASVATIGYNVFRDCTSLTTVTGLDGMACLTSIQQGMFQNCKSLSGTLTIPECITRLPYRMFWHCTSLDNLVVHDGITDGDAEACVGVKNVTYHGSNARAPWGALMLNGNGTIAADGISILSEDGKTLKAVSPTLSGDYVVPDGVTAIADGALSGLTGLKTVTIPDSVEIIGAKAFYNCTGINAITVPNSVTSIGTNAFYGITFVSYDGVATGSPWGATLTSATSKLASDGLSYVSLDGATLKKVPATVSGTYTVPNGVTVIDSKALYQCKNLTDVVFPSGLTSIGYYAFGYCENLTEIVLPGGTESIGGTAFYGCTNLRRVFIPGSVQGIGNQAFGGCPALSDVTIEDGVKTIGSQAFYCTSMSAQLTAISVPSSVTTIGANAFYGVTFVEYAGTATGSPWGAVATSETAKLASDGISCISLDGKELVGVAKNATGDYRIPDGIEVIGSRVCYGNRGLSTITIPDTVTGIGAYAFFNCEKLGALTIPDSVTSIGTNAFYNCMSLKALTIPGSVTSIGEGAFKGCEGLQSITLSAGIKEIGANAFSGCSNVGTISVPNSVTSIGDMAFAGIDFVEYSGEATGSPWGASAASGATQ